VGGECYRYENSLIFITITYIFLYIHTTISIIVIIAHFIYFHFQYSHMMSHIKQLASVSRLQISYSFHFKIIHIDDHALIMIIPHTHVTHSEHGTTYSSVISTQSSMRTKRLPPIIILTGTSPWKSLSIQYSLAHSYGGTGSVEFNSWYSFYPHIFFPNIRDKKKQSKSSCQIVSEVINI
jgi:hypothetical protein